MRLKPNNGEYEDIAVPAKDVRVQGRVLYEICPHGRPIAKRISLSELLREFGRV